jgi:hypothetical protein
MVSLRVHNGLSLNLAVGGLVPRIFLDHTADGGTVAF